MKRFIIQIVDEYSLGSTEEDRCELTIEEYLQIINQAKEKDLYSNANEGVLLSCDICNSFIIPIRALDKFIDKFHEETDYEIELYSIQDKIRVAVHLTDEEWVKYLTEGLKDVTFLYSDDGNLLTDPGGNPYKYLWEECAIVFDPDCSCQNSMIQS